MLPKELEVIMKLSDAVVITDNKNIVLDVNVAYTKLTGYSSEDMIGKNAGRMRTSFTPRHMYTSMYSNLENLEGWSGVFTNRAKNGELWTSSITITPYVIEGNVYYVGVFRALEQLSSGHYLNDRRTKQLQSAVLRVLAISCEIRDPGIEQHLVRVQKMVELLLHKFVKLNKTYTDQIDIKSIVSASILHDIGKSAVPEGILYKPAGLAKHERKIIEMHTYMGIEIFDKIYNEIHDELIVNEYQYAKNIILYHHERFDGTGYPEQLKGNDIPIEARVVSIVDVFDALTSKRPYKDKWEQKDAIDYIVNETGKQFDPELVAAFVTLYEQGSLVDFD